MAASYWRGEVRLKGNQRSLGSQRLLIEANTLDPSKPNIRWQERQKPGPDGWEDYELENTAAGGGTGGGGGDGGEGLVDGSYVDITVAGGGTQMLLNPDTVGLLELEDAAEASLRDRSTHTGTQPIASVTGLQSELTGKAAVVHVHSQSDVLNLTSDLAGKAAAVHSHDASAIVSGVIDQARLPPSSALNNVVPAGGTIPSLTAGEQAQISQGSFVTEADGEIYVYKGVGSKTDTASYTLSGMTSLPWTAITGKPSTFTPSAHSHPQSEVTGLTTDLANKQPLDATLTSLAGLSTAAGLLEQTGTDLFAKRALGVGAASSVLTRADGDGRFAALAHTHGYSSLTGLPVLGTASPLDVAPTGNAATGQVVKGDDTRLTDARTPLAHIHAQSEVTGLTTALAGKQAADPTLTELGNLDSVPGVLEQTGVDTFTKRALGIAGPTSIPTRGDADGRYAALNHSHVAANVTDFAEAVDDRVAGLLVAGANVTLTYNDAANTLTVASAGGGGGGSLADGAYGDITVSGGGTQMLLNADVVGLAELDAAAETSLRDRATHTGSQAQSTVTNLVADLALKAPLASPALTGTPTAPTATAGTTTTQLATTAFAAAALAAHEAAADPHTGYQRETEKGAANGYASLGATTLVPVAQLGSGTANSTRFLRGDGTWQVPPATLADGDYGDVSITGGSWFLDPDTVGLAELDAAAESSLRDRTTHTGVQAQSTVTNLVSDLAAKAPLASPALTGTPTAPTATAGTNTTQLATTAFAAAALAAHEAAADPHTGYQRESEKGVANGYASLGATTLVPVAQLGSGTANSTRFLRGDGTWQVVAATPPDSNYGDITVSGGGTQMLLNADTVGLTELDAAAETSLRDRATHTGSQLAATISDFSTAADARVAAASINALADVTVGTPATNDVLAWNGAGQWVNATPTGGGGGLTQEQVEDAAAAMLTGAVHDGASVAYDDATAKLAITAYGITAHLWDYVTSPTDRAAILAGTYLTDLATQIETARDDLTTAGGGTLELPPGTIYLDECLLHTTNKSDISLRGVYGRTIIKPFAANKFAIISQYSGGTFNAYGAHRVIENIAFDGGMAGNPRGCGLYIQMQTVDLIGVSFWDCVIGLAENSTYYGVRDRCVWRTCDVGTLLCNRITGEATITSLQDSAGGAVSVVLPILNPDDEVHCGGKVFRSGQWASNRLGLVCETFVDRLHLLGGHFEVNQLAVLAIQATGKHPETYGGVKMNYRPVLEDIWFENNGTTGTETFNGVAYDRADLNLRSGVLAVQGADLPTVRVGATGVLDASDVELHQRTNGSITVDTGGLILGRRIEGDGQYFGNVAALQTESLTSFAYGRPVVGIVSAKTVPTRTYSEVKLASRFIGSTFDGGFGLAWGGEGLTWQTADGLFVEQKCLNVVTATTPDGQGVSASTSGLLTLGKTGVLIAGLKAIGGAVTIRFYGEPFLNNAEIILPADRWVQVAVVGVIGAVGSSLYVAAVNLGGAVKTYRISGIALLQFDTPFHAERFLRGAEFPLISDPASVLTGTLAGHDPASVAVDATSAGTNITVTGAALGDRCVATFSLDLGGLYLWAYVSAANTVTFRFTNNTAGAINLGAGTVKVWVFKS